MRCRTYYRIIHRYIFFEKDLCKLRIINNRALIFKVKGCYLCYSSGLCVHNIPEFFTFKLVLFFILSARGRTVFWRLTMFRQKKNHKIIFLPIISFTLKRFKALVNQTFAEHSPWICQASVFTSQINSRVIKLFTQVYWLYSCLVEENPNCYKQQCSQTVKQFIHRKLN